MPKITAPPIKWHGGKHYLARHIVALMPPHVHYVEPYAGGLAILLAKDPRGISECVNDLNEHLIKFWRVLQSPILFSDFFRTVQAIPFSEKEWVDSERRPGNQDVVQAAVAFFIRCRQSLAGRMDTFAPLSRTRTRRGMNEQASAWIGAVDGLPAVHERLRRVVIFNRPALEVVTSQDGPDTLFYLDPPYLHSTRVSTKTYDKYEMTTQDHEELLGLIRTLKGKVLLSGYQSALYDEGLSGWTRYSFDLPNNSAGGSSKRRMVECVWTNF